MTSGLIIHNVPNVIAQRCHFCSRGLPSWRVHQLHNAQAICDDCFEWHKKGLAYLAGEQLEAGCQICRASWEFLRDSTLGSVEVRMYVVPKDGIYQVVCATCISPYVSKRADLFGKTPFGARLKL